MQDINELTGLIQQWARDRNLHTAEAKGKYITHIEDAIGEMYVVMTIYCLQHNIEIDDCIKLAYDKIKDRKGKMVNGVFIKEEDLKNE